MIEETAIQPEGFKVPGEIPPSGVNDSEIRVRESSEKSINPWFMTILFLVLGLLVVGGLVFAGIQIGKKQTQAPVYPTPAPLMVTSPTPVAAVIPTQMTTTTQTPIPTSTPNPDPTVNWKTYTNENLLFEFKYPSEAKLEVLKSSTMPLPDTFKLLYIGPSQKKSGRIETELFDGYIFSVRVVDPMNANPSAVDTASQNAYQNLKNTCPSSAVLSPILTTTLDGKPARTYTVTDCMGDFSEYYILRGKTVFGITQLYNGNSVDKENYKKVLNQILSTFRFLD